MRTTLIWILRIVTMPFRLIAAAIFLVFFLFIAIPLMAIFTIGDPENAIDLVQDQLRNFEYRELGRLVLLGMVD